MLQTPFSTRSIPSPIRKATRNLFQRRIGLPALSTQLFVSQKGILWGTKVSQETFCQAARELAQGYVEGFVTLDNFQDWRVSLADRIA